MEKSRFVNTGNFVPDKNYSAWLKSIKVRLKHAQIKASVRINQSMLEFYWELGHDINALQNTYSWGSGFFEKLSLDLRNEFSGQEGYSVTNLRYIKNWYTFYSQCDTIRYQAGNELKDSMPEKFAYVPWRHHIDILRRCKNLEEALFYIDETITNGWSRREMNFQIDSNLFATLPLTYGADLYTVSKLLGHTNVRTTQIYAKIVDANKRKAVNLIPEL